MNGILVGVKIHPCPLRPRLLQQSVIDQPMLRGDLRRGIPCNPRTDPPALCQQVIHPRLLQKISTQNPRHPSANDQYVRLPAPGKLFESRHLCIFSPNRSHLYHFYPLRPENISLPSFKQSAQKYTNYTKISRFFLPICQMKFRPFVLYFW